MDVFFLKYHNVPSIIDVYDPVSQFHEQQAGLSGAVTAAYGWKYHLIP